MSPENERSCLQIFFDEIILHVIEPALIIR